MRGLEYLRVELLEALWRELAELVADRAARFRGGPAAYLRSVNPLWHLLGRVTFHLAENKRDPERPFAFLATYTHKLSGQARLQHLPLAEALKTYAGAKEQAQARVAAGAGPPGGRAQRAGAGAAGDQGPVRAAGLDACGKRIAFSRNRRGSRRPASWSACPIGGRPAGRRGRRCRCGSATQPASQLGLDRLLDFQVGLALDGEPLTDDERRQLLAGDGRTGPAARQMGRSRSGTAASRRSITGSRSKRSIPTASASSKACGCWPGRSWMPTATADETVAAWSRITAGDWLRETLERMRQPEHHRRLPAGPRSAGHVAAVSGRRRALAVVHDRAGPGGVPGRRHGPGQDDPGDRPAAAAQASRQTANSCQTSRASAACWSCRRR